MKEKLHAYEYPPTEKEVSIAMYKQALISFRFHTDPTMSAEQYAEELENVLAPIKKYKRTEKYTLDELAQLACVPENKRLRKLHQHEDNHALQVKRVLEEMGIATKPEFVVYYCPIMADMHQCGNAIGLLESQGLSGLSRGQLIEFETKLAWKMMVTTQNSVGDLYIIGAIMFAKTINRLKIRAG